MKGVNPRVVAEVIITGGGWTVLAGLEEVAHLLAGKDVNVYAMPEGTIFYPYEPVLRRAMRISRWYGWCEQRCRC